MIGLTRKVLGWASVQGHPNTHSQTQTLTYRNVPPPHSSHLLLTSGTLPRAVLAAFGTVLQKNGNFVPNSRQPTARQGAEDIVDGRQNCLVIRFLSRSFQNHKPFCVLDNRCFSECFPFVTFWNTTRALQRNNKSWLMLKSNKSADKLLSVQTHAALGTPARAKATEGNAGFDFQDDLLLLTRKH